MNNLKLFLLATSVSLVWQAGAALPHPDDLGKQVEHLALLAIVPESQASNTAVVSGNWSDPATWGGNLPANFATIAIPQGITVTVDTTLAPRFKWIRVNGVLNFATTVNTLLQVDTIVVDPVGGFVMGTAAQPISSNVTAKVVYADFGDIDRNWDAFGLSRGLICHGYGRIFGAPTSPYGILAQPAQRGDTTLTLKAPPQNWKIGGRLVLPSVGYIYEGSDGLYNDDDEELTVTGITGNVVSINRPLKYPHLSPTGNAVIPIPVAYLDRNAILTSENFATARRGHNMFMHNWDVQVSDLLVEQCGRTDAARIVTDPQVDAAGRLIAGTSGNDRGRYALHFHRTIPDKAKPARATRVCIVNSPKLGVVNHDSNVIVEDSVAYDVAGSAFFTEVGTEIGAFRRNLAIRTIRGGGNRGDVERFAADGTGAGETALIGGPDFGSNGNGFWFQGAGVEVVDNMAFKTRDMAFVYDTVGFFPNGGAETMFLRSNLTTDNPYYDPNNTGATVHINQVPIVKFSGNIAAGAYTGFMLRKNDPVGKPSVMENSTAVNISGIALDAEYGGPKIFNNMVLRGGTLRSDGSLSGWLNGMGEWGFISNQSSTGMNILNCEFSNFMRGLRFTIRGVDNLKDTILDNVSNITFETGNEAATGPLVAERVTFRHSSAPLQSSDPDLSAHHDVRMYQPFQFLGPVSVNGRSLSYPGVIGGSTYYDNFPSSAPSPGPTAWSYPTTSAGTVVTPPPTASTPVLASAASRKTQGTAGTFDIPLALTGAPGIEGRRSGSNLTLVLTFDQNVVSANAAIASGSGAITSTTFAGNVLTINLGGVADRQTLTVNATNVTGANGAILASCSVPVSMLYTDSDGSGMVDVLDIARTRIRASNGVVNATSFRSDVNGDGVVNVLDVALVKINSGAAVR